MVSKRDARVVNPGLQMAIERMQDFEKSLSDATRRLRAHNDLVERAQKGDAFAREAIRVAFERKHAAE